MEKRVNDDSEALREGDIILEGRYRIVQLLYQRPRLNLYLGRRVSRQSPRSVVMGANAVSEPLVAIRELVLTDLSSGVRKQINAAAFEEFASPVILGASHLPSVGDRVWVERERHYLIMQLRGVKEMQPAVAVTLTELLLNQQRWPSWLSKEVALNWGIQLCQIVGRLHGLGIVLGDLNPAIVLVDNAGAGTWAPVLLISWPPAPRFWPMPFPSADPATSLHSTQIFPRAKASLQNAFVAPEMLNGLCDERSDVYSLGAILYFLLTRYPPIEAGRRLRAAQQNIPLEIEGVPSADLQKLNKSSGLELIPPHLFYSRIPLKLEQILYCALDLQPGLRYPSVSALVDALKAVKLEDEREHRTPSQRGAGGGGMFQWISRHLPIVF